MKDHLSYETTFCGPMVWSIIAGFTVLSLATLPFQLYYFKDIYLIAIEWVNLIMVLIVHISHIMIEWVCKWVYSEGRFASICLEWWVMWLHWHAHKLSAFPPRILLHQAGKVDCKFPTTKTNPILMPSDIQCAIHPWIYWNCKLSELLKQCASHC